MPRRMRVRSPVTHKTYRMTRHNHYAQGPGDFAIYTGRGAHRSVIRVVLYRTFRWRAVAIPMPEEDTLLSWTQALTGLAPERVRAARVQVRSWGFEHTTRELLAPSIDAAVAATMMVEDIAALAARGVARDRLLRKVRHDREVWGTFAELRAAALILQTMPPELMPRVGEGRSAGAHADLRFVKEGEERGISIEVKAVGTVRWRKSLSVVSRPRYGGSFQRWGFVITHSGIDSEIPDERQILAPEKDAQLAQVAEDTPGFPEGLRASVIVGHGSDKRYVERAVSRVIDALRQLPEDDACWVAIYWSNGAPDWSCPNALRWDQIPAHVMGIVLVGCAVISLTR
jgi:hypothetical protein